MRLDTGPSMALRLRQLSVGLSQFLGNSDLPRALSRTEMLLEKERDQLPLWAPVWVGVGIACWFLIDNGWARSGFLISVAALVPLGLAIGIYKRSGRLLFSIALLVFAGFGLIALRSEMVAQPVLDRPVVKKFYGRIVKKEVLAARSLVRLTVETESRQKLPPMVRINISDDKVIEGLEPGAVIALRARLVPPALPALPGAYNFAERAWFMQIGATGSALGQVKLVHRTYRYQVLGRWREQLATHVRTRMDGAAGAIGATLATGDRGAIVEEDAEAMRRSGLAHLLSISGLHVSAVVAGSYLLIMRMLALFPAFALRWSLPLVAAAGAAIMALCYTLITGAQVPTIRACVAALLVLLALAIGRNAFTLRMVAAGALFVLILWPETLIGPSFQLSFAAVTAIIALHEWPPVRALLARRDEAWFRRIGRVMLSLFLTGLLVEFTLMPIALFHFHKAGLYGALANIIAIPLTAFIIMPLEALALLLDGIGLGAPLWWCCERTLSALVWMAHQFSSAPGAVTSLPTMSRWTYCCFVAGGMWVFLWRARWRWAGFGLIAVAMVLLHLTPVPDILITGDGRHLAVRDGDNNLWMLRGRSGDYIRTLLRENAGLEDSPNAMDSWSGAQCNPDTCIILLDKGDRQWRILATRSSYLIPAAALAAACGRVDIVVSARYLPKNCRPRWKKIDRRFLVQNGGVTINLDNRIINTVAAHEGHHPWMRLHTAPASRKTSPRPK